MVGMGSSGGVGGGLPEMEKSIESLSERIRKFITFADGVLSEPRISSSISTQENKILKAAGLLRQAANAFPHLRKDPRERPPLSGPTAVHQGSSVRSSETKRRSSEEEEEEEEGRKRGKRDHLPPGATRPMNVSSLEVSGMMSSGVPFSPNTGHAILAPSTPFARVGDRAPQDPSNDMQESRDPRKKKAPAAYASIPYIEINSTEITHSTEPESSTEYHVPSTTEKLTRAGQRTGAGQKKLVQDELENQRRVIPTAPPVLKSALQKKRNSGPSKKKITFGGTTEHPWQTNNPAPVHHSSPPHALAMQEEEKGKGGKSLKKQKKIMTTDVQPRQHQLPHPRGRSSKDYAESAVESQSSRPQTKKQFLVPLTSNLVAHTNDTAVQYTYGDLPSPGPPAPSGSNARSALSSADPADHRYAPLDLTSASDAADHYGFTIDTSPTDVPERLFDAHEFFLRAENHFIDTLKVHEVKQAVKGHVVWLDFMHKRTAFCTPALITGRSESKSGNVTYSADPFMRSRPEGSMQSIQVGNKTSYTSKIFFGPDTVRTVIKLEDVIMRTHNLPSIATMEDLDKIRDEEVKACLQSIAHCIFCVAKYSLCEGGVIVDFTRKKHRGVLEDFWSTLPSEQERRWLADKLKEKWREDDEEDVFFRYLSIWCEYESEVCNVQSKDYDSDFADYVSDIHEMIEET